MTETVALHLHIEGRVQGVGFRAWLQSRARAVGVQGWVRNRRDGSVEAVLHGEREVVADLAGDCMDGPPLARVDRVVKSDTRPPDAEGFQTLPTL